MNTQMQIIVQSISFDPCEGITSLLQRYLSEELMKTAQQQLIKQKHGDGKESYISASITRGADRKYHEVIEIPPETDIETVTSTYKNGILEIAFKKKQTKGKQINVE